MCLSCPYFLDARVNLPAPFLLGKLQGKPNSKKQTKKQKQKTNTVKRVAVLYATLIPNGNNSGMTDPAVIDIKGGRQRTQGNNIRAVLLQENARRKGKNNATSRVSADTFIQQRLSRHGTRKPTRRGAVPPALQRPLIASSANTHHLLEKKAFCFCARSTKRSDQKGSRSPPVDEHQPVRQNKHPGRQWA